VSGCIGAVGHPEVPDHVTLRGLLLPIRKGFDQGICKRPAVLYEGVESIDPTGEHPSLFEPVHGSGPDIGGNAATDAVVDDLRGRI